MPNIQEKFAKAKQKLTRLRNQVENDKLVIEQLESNVKSLEVLSELKNCETAKIRFWLGSCWSIDIRVEDEEDVEKLRKLVFKIFGVK